MKVIDLLNKIANGEEPNKIKYQNTIYFKSGMNYVNIDECLPIVFMQHIFENSLNDEVEIIEEKEMCHKCGKYPAEYNQTYCEFCLGISEEDKKIKKIGANNYKWNYKYDKKTSQAVVDNLELVRQKINEIIDYINGSDKE